MVRWKREVLVMDSLEHTLRKVLHFRDERDWKQFHTPRNLAGALAIETAELQMAEYLGLKWHEQALPAERVDSRNGFYQRD